MKKVVRHKEGHGTIIKEFILQDDITIFNVYASNNRASKCMGQKLIGLKK